MLESSRSHLVSIFSSQVDLIDYAHFSPQIFFYFLFFYYFFKFCYAFDGKKTIVFSVTVILSYYCYVVLVPSGAELTIQQTKGRTVEQSCQTTQAFTGCQRYR